KNRIGIAVICDDVVGVAVGEARQAEVAGVVVDERVAVVQSRRRGEGDPPGRRVDRLDRRAEGGRAVGVVQEAEGVGRRRAGRQWFLTALKTAVRKVVWSEGCRGDA